LTNAPVCALRNLERIFVPSSHIREAARYSANKKQIKSASSVAQPLRRYILANSFIAIHRAEFQLGGDIDGEEAK
jgi:hypothetical protein